MNLTCRHLPGATLIGVSGQIDTNNSAELEKFIDRQHRRLDEHLIVDMSRLTFLDSSGLAVLLAAAALARAHGVGLHLAAMQSMPARLMEITGALRAVSVYDHVDQAVAAVLGHMSPPERAM
ncbi:STAS domain-containing protein [Nonomuraea candida]|uniref:STAS domain-containing protein n=1 Tax=Nonomuraea candida TaxID=359159 RepID=UPI0005BD97E3|nr:STAS domain-containing protein [Nonomuraea candida]